MEEEGDVENVIDEDEEEESEPEDHEPFGQNDIAEILNEPAQAAVGVELGQQRQSTLQRIVQALRNRMPNSRSLLRMYQRSIHEEVQFPDFVDQTSDAQRPQRSNFDQNLPASHSYLGNLEEISGVPYFDEAYITIPIFLTHDFILLPHQTLPLHISRSKDISLIKSVMKSKDKTFGTLLDITMNTYASYNPEYDHNVPYNELKPKIEIGCTAEIRSVTQQHGDNNDAMRVIVIGRQRFRIMEKETQVDGNIRAKVQILPEDDLISVTQGVKTKCQKVMTKERCRNFHPAWLTRFPPMVYEMYDIDNICNLIFNELGEWYSDKIANMPREPIELSYWLANSIPIDLYTKLDILRLDSIFRRLKLELKLLRHCTKYVCYNCKNLITEKSNVFSMSVVGPMGTYVNPGGCVHETISVYKVKGLVQTSHPSTEHSWFPGYAWSICECANCYHHIGWRFEADKNKDLVPQLFWGLTRGSLRVTSTEYVEFNEGGDYERPDTPQLI